MPLVRNREGPERSVFIANERGRAVRTRRWKFIGRPGEEARELYDLENDAVERENVALEAEHQAVAGRARRRLVEWSRRNQLLAARLEQAAPRAAAPKGVTVHLTDAEKERLRKLGYLAE
jgi:arylsulfatase A-like enzyme